jgi:hypothetical protein
MALRSWPTLSKLAGIASARACPIRSMQPDNINPMMKAFMGIIQ